MQLKAFGFKDLTGIEDFFKKCLAQMKDFHFFCLVSCLYVCLLASFQISYCHSVFSNDTLSLSWVINGWWHQFGSVVYVRLFWFLVSSVIGTRTSTGFDVITWPAYLSLDRQSCIKSSRLALHLGQKTFDLKYLDFDIENVFFLEEPRVLQSVEIL